MDTTNHIVYLTGDTNAGTNVQTYLEATRKQCVVSTCTTETELITAVTELSEAIDCVILDHTESLDGLSALDELQSVAPQCPTIFFPTLRSESVAATALNGGATKYVRRSGSKKQQHARLSAHISDLVSTDITEESRLAERNRQLRAVLDTVSAGIFLKDTDGRYLLMNQETRSILGIDKNRDISGLTDYDVVPEATAKQFLADDKRVLESGETIEIEEEVPTPNGPRHHITRKRPIYDENGEPYGICAVTTDFTERKKREEQLEATTARLSALFENSPDMINLHDLEGKITEANRRMCEVLGYTKTELSGKYVWNIDMSVEEDAVKQMWTEVSADESHKFEGRYQCADGSEVPVEVHLVRLKINQTEQFLVISRDITQQKARERRLKETNEQLESFASIVSHDLRNPLAVLSGWLEIAEDSGSTDAFNRCKKAINRMEQLIDDLLTLARDGAEIADPTPVDLGAISRQAGQTVDLDDATYSISTTQTIEADESRLRQLIENLLRNAVEHNQNNAADATLKITIGALADGFFVSDSGSGIPPEKREEVFEGGYSTSDDGTGFGLSIVEQIATAHGWHVEITDSEDGGARFEFHNVSVVSEPS